MPASVAPAHASAGHPSAQHLYTAVRGTEWASGGTWRRYVRLEARAKVRAPRLAPLPPGPH